MDTRLTFDSFRHRFDMENVSNINLLENMFHASFLDVSIDFLFN